MKNLYLIIVLSFLISQNFKSIAQEDSNKSTKSDPNVPIFEIKNDIGQTVFAVYPGGVKVFIDEGLKATGGGFTVGRLGTGKATGDDYFIVNPGEVNVILPNTPTKATGGGFTVGRLGTGKAAGDPLNFLSVTPDSTRVYISESGTGGFAVGKMGVSTGVNNFLDLTPENYFIGHQSGLKSTGINNLFLGYEAGFSNTTGYQNLFAGYQSGRSNTTGYYNVFIGQSSGLDNIYGRRNVFIGYNAGKSNVGNSASTTVGHDNIYIGTISGQLITGGEHNTLIGSYSAYNTTTATKSTFVGAYTGFAATGTSNVFLGVDAGRNTTTGDNNVFLGAIAGNSCSGSNNTLVGFGAGYFNTAGSGNVFLGRYAGLNETGSNKLYISNSETTTPLIYGDFSGTYLNFNGYVTTTTNKSNTWVNSFRNLGDANDRYGIMIQGGTNDGSGTNYMIGFYNGGGSYEGAITLTNGTLALVNSSDRRLKENILSSSLDAIGILNKLRIVDYNFIKIPNVRQTGYIAQEVLEVFPEMVEYNKENDVYGINPVKLIPLLNKAIQEQYSTIENLKKENTEIKNKLSEINDLKSEIIELKKMYNELAKELNNKSKEIGKTDN